MFKPQISIVIPVYNVEPYLRQCVESIKSQTYKCFEVILVDDGSTDKSGLICDELVKSDERIRVFHRQNEGVSAARNYGIERSKGEWITFIDSDDWVDDKFLEYFELDANPELSIQGLRYVKFPELRIINERVFTSKNVVLLEDLDEIASNNLLDFGTVCCKAYRRDILLNNNIRFNTRISYHEDHILFFQYLQHIKRVSLHSAVAYNYRISGNGTSLSSKAHSWSQLNVSSNILRAQITNILFLNHLSEGYKKKMKSYCVNPKVSATYQLFRTRDTRVHRLSAIDEIWYQDRTAIKDYMPEGLRGKLLKLSLQAGGLCAYWYLTIMMTITKIIHRWR